MKIKNVKVYGMEESILRSQYPMLIGEPHDFYDFDESGESLIEDIDGTNKVEGHLKRANFLAKVPSGTGHDNFLKGIIVQFDLQYTQFITKQLQRYNWFDYISSQSQMHKLTSIDNVKANCNNFVFAEIASVIDSLIDVYNSDFTYPNTFSFLNRTLKVDSKTDLYYYIISNCPMGYQLWTGVTTNYLQLKTMYHQRKNHKLKYDWGYFCDWIESLPMNHLITGKDE